MERQQLIKNVLRAVIIHIFRTLIYIELGKRRKKEHSGTKRNETLSAICTVAVLIKSVHKKKKKVTVVGRRFRSMDYGPPINGVYLIGWIAIRLGRDSETRRKDEEWERRVADT